MGFCEIYDGTYYENLEVNKKINLIGEDRNTTIIDGFKNGPVVTITANKVTITGFTVQNGVANGQGDADTEGGLLAIGGSPKIRNVTFESNAATYSGGGMHIEAANLVIRDVQFLGNRLNWHIIFSMLKI